MTGEMKKFRFLLDQKKIQWIDASDPEDSGSRFLNVDRTWLWYKGKRWSVVHGFGTYGGRSRTYKDEGLLEVMGPFDEDPVGWLTAEQAIKHIMENSNDE